MDALATELEAATIKLRKLDEHRRGQMQYRDDLIRRAKDAGMKWAEIQKLTGLTSRGMQLALARGRAQAAEQSHKRR